MYLCYVSRRSLAWYLGMLGFFALGLVAKPMVITLPFVLLLLDYWPLGRLGGAGSGDGAGRAGRSRDQPALECFAARFSPRPFPRSGAPWFVLGEKLPLLVLVGLSCCLTIWGQRSALGPNRSSAGNGGSRTPRSPTRPTWANSFIPPGCACCIPAAASTCRRRRFSPG